MVDEIIKKESCVKPVKIKPPKYYAVWKGRKTGIFSTWDECKLNVDGYPGAKYKSFLSKQLAEHAITQSPSNYIGKGELATSVKTMLLKSPGKPISDSICVDGACDTGTWNVEYQAIHLGTGKKIFTMGPYKDGTNNIVEFLAIVHALAYCKKNNLDLPIYSDSTIAIGWVLAKHIKTKQERNKNNLSLFELIDRALIWLKENQYSNPILKWETKVWGENPADFGRK